MNFVDSECSSGCESGWTLYLEQSFLSPDSGFYCKEEKSKGKVKNAIEEDYEEEEEEEDLSMVSDASSGPPHFNEEEENYFNHSKGYFCKDPLMVKNGCRNQKKTIKELRHHEKKQELSSFLDDTASSPVFNFSSQKNFALSNNEASMESVLQYSQGFSATHFQGRSAYQDHFEFFHSSLPGNQLHNNQWY